MEFTILFIPIGFLIATLLIAYRWNRKARKQINKDAFDIIGTTYMVLGCIFIGSPFNILLGISVFMWLIEILIPSTKVKMITDLIEDLTYIIGLYGYCIYEIYSLLN